MDKKIKIILLIILALILLAINIMVYISNNDKSKIKENDNQVSTIIEHNIATEEETENSRKEMLNEYSEATRMKTYVGQYLSYIDSEKYEDAYNLLYQNFKNTYFKTLVDFENYAKEKYPSEIMAEYTNMNKEGNIYILSVKIQDPTNKEYKTLEQNIVIQENDLNDFVLSFNVE